MILISVEAVCVMSGDVGEVNGRPAGDNSAFTIEAALTAMNPKGPLRQPRRSDNGGPSGAPGLSQAVHPAARVCP